MKEYNWKNIEAIFNEAIILSSERQKSFVGDACGENTDLKNDILSLISEAKSDILTSSSNFELGLEVLASEIESLLTEPEFSKYKLVSVLGRGGTGVVFLAFDELLERNVAIKVFNKIYYDDRRILSKLKREAMAASAIACPNLVHIYEYGEAKGQFFIVMEYISGKTLRQLLSEKMLGPLEVIEIVIQIAKALEAMHLKGFIHRDIKPENIIISTHNSVKLLDFGLAKPLSQTYKFLSEANSNTTEGMILGTSAYMSPEQIRGQELDFKTDFWSLGIIIYEMLAGGRPFTGETKSDVLASILIKNIFEEDPIIKDKVFGRILLKLLNKDRRQRYQSASDIIEDLRHTYRSLLAKGEKKYSTRFPEKILHYRKSLLRYIKFLRRK